MRCQSSTPCDNCKRTALLIGLRVKADHPITVLNPDETFVIYDARIENGNIYARGELTMWFASSDLLRIDAPAPNEQGE